MAVPLAVAILAFIARVGGPTAVKQAVKKFGKKAVLKATNKMTYVGKEAIKKSKTYKDTKVFKETEKIRTRLGLKDKQKGGTVKKYAGGSKVRKPINY